MAKDTHKLQYLAEFYEIFWLNGEYKQKIILCCYELPFYSQKNVSSNLLLLPLLTTDRHYFQVYCYMQMVWHQELNFLSISNLKELILGHFWKIINILYKYFQLVLSDTYDTITLLQEYIIIQLFL